MCNVWKCFTTLKGTTAMFIFMNYMINNVEKYFLNLKTFRKFSEEINMVILSVTYANALCPKE